MKDKELREIVDRELHELRERNWKLDRLLHEFMHILGYEETHVTEHTKITKKKDQP